MTTPAPPAAPPLYYYPAAQQIVYVPQIDPYTGQTVLSPALMAPPPAWYPPPAARSGASVAQSTEDGLSDAPSSSRGSTAGCIPCKTGQRVVRFTRPPPRWHLPHGRVSPRERAQLPDEYAPVDLAIFRVFPLRGPMDLAELLVTLGFEFDAHSPVGVLRARLPRDSSANRCSGYAFVECRNRAVAQLLERKLQGLTLSSVNAEGNETTYSVGVGEVKNRQGAMARKLKLEWKAVVAPGCVTSTQREVSYTEVCTAPH